MICHRWWTIVVARTTTFAKLGAITFKVVAILTACRTSRLVAGCCLGGAILRRLPVINKDLHQGKAAYLQRSSLLGPNIRVA